MWRPFYRDTGERRRGEGVGDQTHLWWCWQLSKHTGLQDLKWLVVVYVEVLQWKKNALISTLLVHVFKQTQWTKYTQKHSGTLCTLKTQQMSACVCLTLSQSLSHTACYFTRAVMGKMIKVQSGWWTSVVNTLRSQLDSYQHLTNSIRASAINTRQKIL